MEANTKREGNFSEKLKALFFLKSNRSQYHSQATDISSVTC